jgi:hypothetical protein
VDYGAPFYVLMAVMLPLLGYLVWDILGMLGVFGAVGRLAYRVLFGRRRASRRMRRLQGQWRQEFERSRGRAPVVLPDSMSGVSMELAGERLSAAFGPCAHVGAVPVESDGELVAWLCPACDRQLSAGWSVRG